VNACWYYRPEQTVHRYDKFFLENEVVKTGRYRDHPIEDVEDRCFVMFVTRYPRGRPRGLPGDKAVYVCESRYNEEKHRFAKIKTWNSCLPDEVRDKDYEMDLFDSPRPMKKNPSPIKHLLQADAKETDEHPKPTWGGPNAPPLIGAVHRRPREKNVSDHGALTASRTLSPSHLLPFSGVSLASYAFPMLPKPSAHFPRFSAWRILPSLAATSTPSSPLPKPQARETEKPRADHGVPHPGFSSPRAASCPSRPSSRPAGDGALKSSRGGRTRYGRTVPSSWRCRPCSGCVTLALPAVPGGAALRPATSSPWSWCPGTHPAATPNA
jgi:hypothetical protein